MARFLAAVAALIALIAAILVLAPNLLPTETYKPLLERAASNAVGRSVTFGEDVSFRIVPKTAFRVSDLTIANAEGFDGAYLARVAEADIGVKLLPLLSRSVEIDSFVLTEPSVNLQKRADDSVNWNLVAADAAEGAAGGDANEASVEQTGAEETGAEETGAGAGVNDLRLGDVRIVDGRFVYADAAAGQTYKAEAVNLAVRLESFSEPLEAEGDMIFQGAPSTVRLVLSTISDVLNKSPANMKLDATLGEASVGADLDIAESDTLQYAGPIAVDAPDLPALARLFAVEMEDAPGFDSLRVNGAAAGDATSLRLKDATILFDAIDARGDLGLDWSGEKPKATGALQAETLDLRPYLPPPPPVPGSGFPEWSDAPMDLTSLRNIDADIDLGASRILLNDIETGASRMKLSIQNGRMTADIPQLQLYGGGGSGRMVVNARQSTPSFSGYFDISSVRAEGFAADFLKTDKLLGLGAMRFEFAASGASQAAIMSSLDGKGGFDLEDGALKGVNIVKLASAVKTIIDGGAANPAAVASAIAGARQPNEQTDFTKFLSQFNIENGVARAPRIQLDGPFLTMGGAGSVNLPAQSIDLRLAPRVLTRTDGKEAPSLEIPLLVGGTFSEPAIQVDLESLLRGQLEGRGRDLLNKVLGGAESDEEDGGGDPAKALLRGLLQPKKEEE